MTCRGRVRPPIRRCQEHFDDWLRIIPEEIVAFERATEIGGIGR